MLTPFQIMFYICTTYLGLLVFINAIHTGISYTSLPNQWQWQGSGAAYQKQIHVLRRKRGRDETEAHNKKSLTSL